MLRAVLSWASETGLLPKGNPLAGKRLELPKEKNSVRVTVIESDYQALLAVADQVDWRFKGMLILAHETGHRIGAVRQLLSSDIDLDARTIRWRAETEKTGYGHVTPLTMTAEEALREIQAKRPGIGDAPIFPADKNLANPWTDSGPRSGGGRRRWRRSSCPRRGVGGTRCDGSSRRTSCTSR